jgi:hypothetical protein
MIRLRAFRVLVVQVGWRRPIALATVDTMLRAILQPERGMS